MKKLITLLLFVFCVICLNAQMVIKGDTLVGNEWIDYDKAYVKIKIAENGVYKIIGAELEAAGMEITQKEAIYLQMIHNGKEIPIFTSVTGLINADSYIKFYGEKNTIALDSFMYKNWNKDLLNPKYSLISDTSVYYLTFADSNVDRKRYKTIVHNYETNVLSPEPYFYHESILEYHNSYFKPTYRGNDKIKLSNFVSSEGFSKGLSRNTKITIPTPNVFKDQVLPTNLNYRIGSNGLFFNSKEYRINGELIKKDTTSEYDVVKGSFPLLNTNLNNSIEFEITNVGQNDQHMLATVAVDYPRNFNFSGANKFTINLGGGKKYIELENFDFDDNNIVLDPNNSRRYFISDRGNGITGIIIDGNNPQQIELYANAKSSAKIEKVNFENPINWNPTYVIISSEKLYNTIGAERDVLQEYIEYRNSNEGGSFNSRLIFTDFIYDQFGYGVPNHLHAYKNFAYWAKKNWPLEYVNIIGKGREYHAVRTNAQIADPINNSFFVPSYGNSPSDFLLFSFEDRPNPYFAIGRIAAKNMEETGNYLDKMKTHTAAINAPQEKDKLWLKNVLHLGGGGTTGEQNSIRLFLDQMASEIINNNFGANVITYSKSSVEGTIQQADIDEIEDAINNGVSMINFFGHASVGTWDFSLNSSDFYQNEGKLPFVFSLGCYSGNFCTTTSGISEDWVLSKDKGAIGYIASSGSAYLSTQGIYGKSFYTSLGNEFYNESIGNMFKIVNERNKDENDVGRLNLLQQFALHCDPAVKIHGFEKPDYIVDYESVKIDPNIVQVTDDKFNFSFNVLNIGKGIEDSLSIKLIHILPSGDTTVIEEKKIRAPKYSSNYNIDFTIPGLDALGINKIEVEVDELNNIEELEEGNNRLINSAGDYGFDVNIIDNGIRQIYPSEFAIINKKDFNFIVSTGNAFSKDIPIEFQMDTTELFNSNFLIEKKSVVSGGSAVISADFDFVSDVVYYWRVKVDNGENDAMWQNSSFIYLPNEEEGWNQSHYFQYLKDNFEGQVLLPNREFQFDTSGIFFKIFNGVWDGGTNVGWQYNFESYAVSVRPWNFLDGGVAVVIQDGITGAEIINTGGDYGSINTSNFGSYRCYGYDTKKFESRESLINLLQNVTETGQYVFFFTVLRNNNSDIGIDQWESDKDILGTNIFEVLNGYGAEFVDSLKTRGSVAYNYVFKKGEGKLGEDIAEDKSDYIVTQTFTATLRKNGEISSKKIGPASDWGNLKWDVGEFEEADTFSITVYGISTTNDTLELLKTTDYLSDLSFINAQEYPYIFIKYQAKDELLRSVPQLNYWRINYLPLPDVAFELTNNYYVKDSLQRGEPIVIEFNAINLRNVNMDSLLVKFSLKNNENNLIEEFQRFDKILQKGKTKVQFNKETMNLAGDYLLEVELNPNEDQQELILFNNLGTKVINIFSENINPILDVTFDGNSIMNGDFVASNPIIKIRLKDENKYLLLNDPQNIQLKLLYPNENIPQSISSSDFTFEPANSGDNNVATITFNPFLEDGEYTLYVDANDNTGNESGKESFSIDFNVLSKKSITNVLNYPNPFSTSTQFVFTLTGEIPDQFSIQIMTVTGKVVKEITKQELGLLKIGNNITDYRWDGTDEFGNKLGNGTYFYKLLMGKDANRFESRTTNTDHMFKQGFGKLTILR